MKNKKKKVILIVSVLLMSMMFSTASKAVEKKKGMYVVEGYMIKSLTKSGNKIKVVTDKSKQMTTVRGEHIVFLKGKTFSFNLSSKVDYSAQYYTTGNIKSVKWSKIKKLVKISRKNKFSYETAKENEYSSLTTADYPRLYIIVDKKGKVTDVMYTEGEFDILAYN